MDLETWYLSHCGQSFGGAEITALNGCTFGLFQRFKVWVIKLLGAHDEMKWQGLSPTYVINFYQQRSDFQLSENKVHIAAIGVLDLKARQLFCLPGTQEIS